MITLPQLRFRMWIVALKRYADLGDFAIDCNGRLLENMGNGEYCESGLAVVAERYTGFTDKYGTSIYEGDLMEYIRENNSEREWNSTVDHSIAVVKWIDGVYEIDRTPLFRYTKEHWLVREYKVVGNTHESPIKPMRKSIRQDHDDDDDLDV